MKAKVYLIVSISILLVSLTTAESYSQAYHNNSGLKLEDIMKGDDWLGVSPGNPQWSADSKTVYFTWNPDKELFTSAYSYSLETGKISKPGDEERANRVLAGSLIQGCEGDKQYFVDGGDLYNYDIESNTRILILDLDAPIISPFLSPDKELLYFTLNNNLYKYVVSSGKILKLTNFIKDAASPEKKPWSNDQEEWLFKDQEELFDIIKQNNERSEFRKAIRNSSEDKLPVEIPTGKARLSGISINGSGTFVTYTLFHPLQGGKRAEMPRYVTETGFTESDNVRSKVGYVSGKMELGIFDIKRDTFYYSDISLLPSINDYLVYEEEQRVETRDKPRNVFFSSPLWSPDGKTAIVNIRSTDNKDRWIANIDLESGELHCLDHQRDEAWISGPGIGWSMSGGTLGWLDNSRFYFQSEESGYSHLYLYDLKKNKQKALTKGSFEIYQPFLSKDKESFYYTSNEVHSGEHHFYKMDIKNGKKVKLTELTGHNEVSLSPDEQTMIIRYSYATSPWELYKREKNSDNSWGEVKKITNSYTDDFKAYKWKDPDFIEVKASDGKLIPARLYRPEKANSNGCGVIFVHGAGYLQNAHKGWSSYFREYMFHNFLVDNGYTVLDMDYRASAGYGRYWRTAIYRHMGGKDLSDNVDGARFLVENEGVDPEKIGIYGGSYGGFITLMAQFTAPGVFKAGAALRPVTDWAHYNHGYTSNILNTPVEDPIAYRKSSPIYFADGLEDHLIMCHGMVDDNVHFQDVVRLTQRLIELQKDNWEVAMYPIEPHSFREWTSWLDEYKRIYKLFEETLNSK